MKSKHGTTRDIVTRVKDLRIHPTAQRMLIKSHVAKIKERFNRNAVHVFSAVDYPIRGKAGPWLVDGQHRWRAMMDLGLGDAEVIVLVYTDVLDDRAASQLFLDLNRKATVSAFDTFQNELRAKVPVAVGVQQVLRQYGLTVGRKRGKGQVDCATSLKDLWSLDSGVTLDMALDVAHRAWARSSEIAPERHIIIGLAKLMAAYARQIDQKRLAHKLAAWHGGTKAIVDSAILTHKSRNLPIAMGVAEEIGRIYNIGSHRTSRIDESIFRDARRARTEAKHSPEQADKPTCVADLKAMYAKHGADLTRRRFVKESATARRYEKLWPNFTEFCKEAGVQLAA